MRVVNPVTPGLGGPQVNKAAGWLARALVQRSRAGSHSDRVRRTATSFFSSTLWDEDRKPDGTTRESGENQKEFDSFVKGLILAQNERWRRGLGMQVERAW